MLDDADSQNYLSPARQAQIVGEFAAMSPDGAVVTCGGEPMLNLDAYFGLCRTVRDAGLRMLSVVNGTRIRTSQMAERMVLAGPHEISVSLNAPSSFEHDRTRGISGAFGQATRAIKLLLEARERLGATDTRVYVMGLIYASNHRLIPQFYDFVLKELKADKLKLNFIQPTFGQSGEIDPFFAMESKVDSAAVVELIKQSDQRHQLGLNPQWLDDVSMYFESLADIADSDRGWHSQGRTARHICNTYDRNIMIDSYGMARLCFSHDFRGEKLEQPGDLLRLWQGAADIRDKMRDCNRFCGISHSVRRQSSTMEGLAKVESFKAAHAGRSGAE